MERIIAAMATPKATIAFAAVGAFLALVGYVAPLVYSLILVAQAVLAVGSSVM